jgi:hypothetical protein
MSKTQPGKEEAKARKPLVWLHGEIKTPPFSFEGRQEAGMLFACCRKGMYWGCLRQRHCRMSGAMRRFAGSRRGAQLENHVSHRCRCCPDSGCLLQEDPEDPERGN